MKVAGWMVRVLLAAGVLAGATVAAHHYLETRLVPDGCLAEGLVVEGVVITGCADAENVAAKRVAALLARQVTVFRGDEVIVEATLAELGAIADGAWVEAQMSAVGHTGSIWQRLDDAAEARAGRLSVRVPWDLPADVLAPRLASFKARYDQDPVAARWDFSADRATEHADGRTVDVHATIEAVAMARAAGSIRVPLVVHDVPPAATREVVAGIDRSALIARYQTRFGFVGNQASRAQNVARAAAGIDGRVMMPGSVVSFNELVGPRSVDNGFAPAGEIYKGEMRMGIGGGTCQVASTFHAAAYFGALEIVERSPHSRPSGYIGIGLDATVAYPHVDLQLKNPFDFPVLIHATSERGLLTVELVGREQPATVELSTATVAVEPYERTVREASWLEAGKVVRKQGGRRGVTIEKVRTLRFGDGRVRVETTRDVYPPTNEIFYVPRGADSASLLPPLPEGVAEG